MTNRPEILAKCEVCSDESNCHPPEEVRLADGVWTCDYCYDSDELGTPEDFRKLPSAAEWVTVREAPAKTKDFTKCTSCSGLGTHLDVSQDKKTKCTECDGTGYMETEK